MAPQEDGRREGKDERGPPFWLTDDEDKPPSTTVSGTDLTILSSIVSVSETSMMPPMPTLVVISIETASDSYPSPTDESIMPSSRPSQVPSYVPWPPPWAYESLSSATKSSLASVTSPYADGWVTSTISATPTDLATYKETAPPTTTGPYGGRPTGWDWSRRHANHTPMYAAAAVVPIVVLTIIGVVAFVCLRKRKRRNAEVAAAQTIPQEMSMKQKPTAQPYLATPLPPPIAISRQYTASSVQLPPTSTPSQYQPIILGPIGSGSNGTYLTGMDTSDMVSVTSNTLRPADPFADNNSLTEPPPPYRPSSVAPPSFTSNSRQSSLRTSAPPTTSQTHLIERSPFDDPDEDDTVSELSGPTIGRDADAMSAVSDLSYQRDPFAGRTTP
jgi:hypothetical protein